MYDTFMSTPGNTAKLGATHSNIIDSIKRSVPGWERTYNALVSTPLSQHSHTMPARHKTEHTMTKDQLKTEIKQKNRQIEV